MGRNELIAALVVQPALLAAMDAAHRHPVGLVEDML